MSDFNVHSLREELEVRVIALITGELSQSDAEELEKIIANDEALATYRDQMARLLGNLHEARDEIAPPTPTHELRLSEDRRRAIFGDTYISPEDLTDIDTPVNWRRRILGIAAAMTTLLILSAIFIPTVGSVKRTASFSQDRAEQEPLKQLNESEAGSFVLQTEIPNELIEGTPQPIRLRAVTPNARPRETFALKQLEAAPPPPVEESFAYEATMPPAQSKALSDQTSVMAESYYNDGPVDYFASPNSASMPAINYDEIAIAERQAATKEEDSEPFAEVFDSAVQSMYRDNDTVEASLKKVISKNARVYQLGSSLREVPGAKTNTLPENRSDQSSGMLTRKEDLNSTPSTASLYEPNPLESIVIPQVNFSGMPISRVVETLNELSYEYAENGTGVNIIYNPIADEDPLINITLRNLSLDRVLQFIAEQANLDFDREGDAYVIQGKNPRAIESTTITRRQRVTQTPKPEKQTALAPVSTFSLNVSDVSFKLAQAALESRRIPETALIRSEEFVNSFSYQDPTPRKDEPVALHWEIAQHPYAHNRQIVRFSIQTQASGRKRGQPLNLNLLVDNSGSMQRPDRRAILEKSLESLQSKLTDQDQLNIILFARQPKLIANANSIVSQQAAIADTLAYQPEGGTNLEAGLEAAYQNAQAHFNPTASNRVILMTDGAANLGDVNPTALASKVIYNRKQGIALDAYGIGWEDYNDTLLEEITRNGDGRYAFLNSPKTAATEFAEKLAGTLQVAAADVKVQIIWNPERVRTYRQIGYDLHQLKEQDFRDNSVDAAEIAEAESGTALYVLQIDEDPEVVGALGKLQVRYRVPATGEYIEQAWPLEMPRSIPQLEEAPASLRLAATSALFAEYLADNPHAADYGLEDLSIFSRDLPQAFPTQTRVLELHSMIETAGSLFNRPE